MIQRLQAIQRLRSASPLPNSSVVKTWPYFNSWALLTFLIMTNHHLSVEQRFHLESAFREIDACKDINMLRSLTKQIITAQENEKAFAREAMVQVRKEMEAAASQRFGFNWGQSS